MTLSHVEIAARVRRLAVTLGDLKARVREAVATETGRAVAEAVKDLLTAALRGTASRDPDRAAAYPPHHRNWDPEEDGWEEDRDDEPLPTPPSQSSLSWRTVLMLTVAVVKEWADRRLPAWAATAVGLAAGAAAVLGGPLLHASLAVAVAASELVPLLVSNAIRI